MATLPGGQTIGANQVNLGTVTAPVIKTVGTTTDPNTVLTQGQSFTDPSGNTGTVNYDTKTGQKLGTGQATFASPTSVVSSASALNQYNQMQAVASTAAQSQVSHAQQSQQNLATNQGAGVSNSPAAGNTPAQPAPTSAEDKIMNAPEEGMQEAYNVQTGQRQDQPSDQPIPTGYSATNPQTRTDVVATADAGDGIQIKQFSDGTYGRFNSITGSYTSGTQGEFQQAQTVSNTQKQLTDLQNGIYTPAQQNQINAIQQSYASLIQQQQNANANSTGATTLAENMYGLGNTLTGQGVITQSINDGVNKIATLQSKMNSDITALTQSFNSEDTDAAKTAFDQYSTTQANIQKTLDDMQSQIQAAKNYDLEVQKDKEQQDQNAISDKLESDKFTWQQKQDSFQNYISSANLNIAQRKEALDEYTAQQNAAIENVSPNTPIGNIPGVQTMSSTGLQYFDPTNIVDTKQRAAASAAAQKNGVPIVDPKDAPVVEKLDNALSQLSTLADNATALAPANFPGAKPASKLENIAGELSSGLGYTTDYQAKLQAYNQNKQELISLVSALSGQSSRLSPALLNSISTSLPSFQTFKTDNSAEVQAKLNLTRQNIYSALKSVVPGISLPASGAPIYPTLQAYAQANPGKQAETAQVAQDHPTWTSDMILKYVNN